VKALVWSKQMPDANNIIESKKAAVSMVCYSKSLETGALSIYWQEV